MIERYFDVPFIAGMALREKQIQQNYRPIIAVHKWFARRPGTLFRGLLLAEFGHVPVWQTFFAGNSLRGRRVLDPFMGGGTTMVEANRLGCDVTGFDINPMAWWIVRQAIQFLDVDAYLCEALRLRERLEGEVGELYRTRCERCGSREAAVKYFLWVKVASCSGCGEDIDLFPNYLLAEDVRHPRNVFVCASCGELYETESRETPGSCPQCGHEYHREFIARRNRVKCKACKAVNIYPGSDAPRHRLFAIEYHCPKCAGSAAGRMFKRPDGADIAKCAEAERHLAKMRLRFAPSDPILAGDETARLHRWGYARYRELFNARQLLGLEQSCSFIAAIESAPIREALATNLSDLLRYQNMLCRYDTMALKSLDVFSVHGFPVGLIQCESNILGIAHPAKRQPVGSGGWINIIEKFTRAKRYCERPFEIRHERGRKIEVAIGGEWIGERRNGSPPTEARSVRLTCADAASVDLGKRTFDAVFTDPPYFGNVQYAELMDFCFVWLRRLVGNEHPQFAVETTRHAAELTGNANMGRDLAHFTEGISRSFRKAAASLKEGGPLAFTYHHNQLPAYFPIVVAILDTGLTCSASLPCPAEMGGSIHINGTGSSIVDTVFVCRSTGRVPRRWIASNAADLARLVRDDVALLVEGGLKPTKGDVRCIAYGQLARIAIWNLRGGWQLNRASDQRLGRVAEWIAAFGGAEAVLAAVGGDFTAARATQSWKVCEGGSDHSSGEDEIPF